MLILTRKIGETIVVGDDVKVTVLGVEGNQVRIGFKAPPEISVHRQEIYQKVQVEKAIQSGDSSYVPKSQPAEIKKSVKSDSIGFKSNDALTPNDQIQYRQMPNDREVEVKKPLIRSKRRGGKSWDI